MNGSIQNLPSGWHLDPDTGAWMRDTIHHMGRRCRNWDYHGRGVYLITIAAATRGSGIWGRVVAEVASDSALTEAGVPRVGVKEAGVPHVGVKEAGAPHVGVKEAGVPRVGVSPLAVKSSVKFRPNAIGRLIEAEWLHLAEAWPGVKLLAHQVMEDHFHGVIATPSFMQKPLGAIIGSFKARSSSVAGKSLWSKGYVDTILFDNVAVEKAIQYVRENPWHLFVKRGNPELFLVKRGLEVKGIGHFAAIGNHFLLDAPHILQVQCSRTHFAYARRSDGSIDKETHPLVATSEFSEKAEGLLEAAAHGAVLVSPCISHAEKEIARRAFAAGAKVITLANKGFSPLYKPGGKLFDQCANGNLLMLAPAAWPYLPGKKPITRIDACVLNRIAQLIAGNGATEIDYKGIRLEGVEEAMHRATRRME